jgi:hypothetical protein
MQHAPSTDHSKWILYTWPDATFSAINVPENWRYTQPVPASAGGATRFQSSYDALDVLLKARRGPADRGRGHAPERG